MQQERTSGAKALINRAIYGTAQAVPFVQSLSSACKGLYQSSLQDYRDLRKFTQDYVLS
jgi:hypothetical protein